MRFFTFIFTLLLLYSIAALLYWGFRLQRQSRIIYNIERTDLPHQIDSLRQPALYSQRIAGLNVELDKRRRQYYGEGGTLLLVLLVGAAVVYTSLQRKVRLQRQQSNFMLAVTHELKSPIAGMKLSLQTIQRHKLSEEQRAQLIGRCIQEADRLSDLCNNMLITSQLEARQYKIAREALSLSEIVSDSAAVYAARYPGRILTKIETDCSVTGDMLMLQVVFNNLLENAIKYTPPETPIEVRLLKGKGETIMQVADRGAGITDEEKKKVFTKFYRIGDEATRRTKGTGLGLYLTKKIVQQLKGRISVKDNAPNGAVFQVSLPCG